MKVFRVLSLLLSVATVSLLGWFFWDQYTSRQTERRLRAEIARLTEETPAAKVICDAVIVAEDGTATTHLRFAELDSKGEARPNRPVRKLVVRGREAYFDTYQIIFGTDKVREADPLRGKTLTLWRGVYGENERPSEATPLDVPASVFKKSFDPTKDSGIVPTRFQSTDAAAENFERALWRDLWALATDKKYADSQGVRTVQGTAVHKPMVAGKEYRLSVDNKGQILFDGPFDPDPFVTPQR